MFKLPSEDTQNLKHWLAKLGINGNPQMVQICDSRGIHVVGNIQEGVHKSTWNKTKNFAGENLLTALLSVDCTLKHVDQD